LANHISRRSASDIKAQLLVFDQTLSLIWKFGKEKFHTLFVSLPQKLKFSLQAKFLALAHILLGFNFLFLSLKHYVK
jgi:hypothetical protein